MAFFFDSDEHNRAVPQDLNSFHPSAGRKNYQYFKKRLHQEILRSQRREHPFALMRITVGAEGNEGLEEILKSSIREYDLFCTVHPTEYAVVFPETNERYAEVIAERIRASFSGRNDVNAPAYPMETNIGIACFPRDGTNAEDLLESAEQDLLHQKNKRR